MRPNLIGILIVAGLAVAGCQSSAEPQEAELGTGAAFIQTVDVEERDGEYWAVVEGWYPALPSRLSDFRSSMGSSPWVVIS